MNKFLLPIFGGVLLTSSVALTTGQNANVVVKQEEKKENLFNSWHTINSQAQLTEEQIKAAQSAYQNWDKEAIDSILNQALQYQNYQLIIDWNKVDSTKLPAQLLEHIDLALDNLNLAVSQGFIKVNVVDNMVQLVYPSNNSEALKNDEIIEFKSSVSAYGSYMWYSTYGPSRWWKFWEWGGIIHFSEQAVKNAKWFNLAASLVNIYFLFKNIKQISNIVNELKSVWEAGNVAKSNDLMKQLSNILGGIELSLLGDIADVLAVFTAVVAFGLALVTGGGFVAALVELIAGIIVSVTGTMMNVDKGYGVKWQWPNFVIPGKITAE